MAWRLPKRDGKQGQSVTRKVPQELVKTAKTYPAAPTYKEASGWETPKENDLVSHKE